MSSEVPNSDSSELPEDESRAGGQAEPWTEDDDWLRAGRRADPSAADGVDWSREGLLADLSVSDGEEWS